MTQHGKFWWNELATTDTDACKSFYSSVLGWGSEEMQGSPDGPYTVWKVGDDNVGGMLKMNGPQWQGIPPHWLAYIAVDDVDKRIDAAKSAGGSVKTEPFDVPGIGRIAVIADPAGAVVALITPAPEMAG